MPTTTAPVKISKSSLSSKNSALATSLASYSELKRRVRITIEEGKKRAEAAVEREKVRTAWRVGKLILEHNLHHRERADYGKQAVKRLAADLALSHTELGYMLEYARANPISPPAGKLSWAHHRELLSINEDGPRKELTRQAERKKWTRAVLRSEIKKLKAAKQITVSPTSSEELLVPIKGTLDTYRIIKAVAGLWQGKPVIDLGFSNYYRPEGTLPFKEKEIIRVSKNEAKRVKEATEADLFTYRAYVLDVTDGDTIWFLIDLGFGFTTRQHLRLRGIDSPELDTAAGQRAKRFAEQLLSSPRKRGTSEKTPPVTITSTKSDKYDRYLADVFIAPARDFKISAGRTRATGHECTTKTGEVFLNNQLLESHLAVRL